MRYAVYAMIAKSLALLVSTALPAAAATFSVADEEDGPVCWLDFQMSGSQTLAIFSAKGRGGKAVDMLLEDRKDTGSLAKVPETFDLAFQFADGTHRSYRGSISEYFGEPYVEAQPSPLEKLSDGKGFKIAVSGLGAIPIKDTLSRKTYKQFLNCVSR